MSEYTSDEVREMVTEDVRDAWEGEGTYRIAWSDGGQSYDARRYGSADELADDLRGAYLDASETHLPYAERCEED